MQRTYPDCRCYIKEYELRSLDTDRNDTLRPNAVQELLQDAAGRHAEQLGVGMQSLRRENLTWVLVSTQTQLFGKVEYMGKLTVKTWPLKSNGVRFQREYLMYGRDNRVVAKSTSVWTLMDISSRRIARRKEAYRNIEAFLEEKLFEEKYVKVSVPEQGWSWVDIPVKPSDIDINGHVNNTKYLTFVTDSIGLADGQWIKGYQIDYVKEVKPRETLRLYHQPSGSGYVAKGVVGEKDVVFCAFVEVGESFA